MIFEAQASSHPQRSFCEAIQHCNMLTHGCCRHKGSGSELGKQQPFARSESTAADVLKRRQALAELEMLPCTFHPALDPHSLAIVAAKVKTVLLSLPKA